VVPLALPRPWPVSSFGPVARRRNGWRGDGTLSSGNSFALVWVQWYEDRLAGRARSEAHELVYVEVPDELWEQGMAGDPAVVNTWIMRRFDRLADQSISESEPASAAPETQLGVPRLLDIEVIPLQAPAASQFALAVDGRIDLARDTPGHSPLADAMQREQYLEVRYKALGLEGLGHNQLGDISGSVGRFIEAVPPRLEAASITRLWSRGNTLRRRLDANDDAIADAGDPARLSPLVAEMLRDLVETYNVFIIGDPKGRELDQVRLGPLERSAAKAIAEAALPIVEALQVSEGIATTDAVSALVEQSEAAKTTVVGTNGDQAVALASKTSSNFVVELLRVAYRPIREMKAEAGFGWKEVRAGAYRAVGAAIPVGAYYYNQEIIAFIIKNANILMAFVARAFDNPALIRIIELIVR
jgi:hypothetical protein